MKQIKRERPPMPPLSVRVKVAERQVAESNRWAFAVYQGMDYPSNGARLEALLMVLFLQNNGGMKPHALDHDPALILRPYNPRIRDVAARYTPHAHDPEALIYREKADHQQKTTGRKPGAAKTVTTKGSDIGLKTKFARLEGRTKKPPKRKWASRPFPKGRGFRKPPVDK